MCSLSFCLFFFNDTATTEIYTLSLHDALPIWILPCRYMETPRIASIERRAKLVGNRVTPVLAKAARSDADAQDRKSTRLNSSHSQISYAVFCLKKKKKKKENK